MKILVTGGTVFVSKYAAQYFAQKGHEVFVLNRGTRPQVPGVTLLKADRHSLGDILKPHRFDAVLDITAYSGADVENLLAGLGEFDQYILVSSSSVYPQTLPQPFQEDMPLGENIHWGGYGMGKIEAEKVLAGKVPGTYILRPPYLYGPMNNVYREAFVFDCAEQDRPFYLPGEGKLPLQFFHIEDLCRFMELLLEKRPRKRVYNAGNPKAVTVAEWVKLRYGALGKEPAFISVPEDVPQRSYFPFLNYAYSLEVSAQQMLMPALKDLGTGLEEAYSWYKEHKEEVRAKPLLAFIEENLNAK